MSCPVNKIDSNNTGLRYAEEECLKQLPEGVEATYASGVLTLTDKGTEGDTITIGDRTYTLRNTFDADEDEIIIGATADETAARIAEAINNGYSAGASAYIGTGTDPHDDVEAAQNAGVVSVVAQNDGAAGNAIVTHTLGAGLSFNAATLTGGAEAQNVATVWHVLDSISFSDFGGQISTVARNPINPSRQRKKGVTTDLEASGGFNQDLTLNNTTRLLQGFFFADMREKHSTALLNSPAVPFTSVTAATATYGAAAGLTGFASGRLVLASGFGSSANNGLKRMTQASSGTEIKVTGGVAPVDEANPPATAKIEVVGHEFASGAVNMALQGALVRMTSSSFNMTTLGLTPGEWIYVGGDGSGKHFANSVGFARVAVIQSGHLEFDKVSWAPSNENGAGITLHIFFGSVLRNEDNPNLIKRRTYQVERTLGRDADGTMSEYLIGAVPNELTLNIAQADKVNIDMGFIAVDNEQRTGQQGLKAGARPALEPADAFNTSSDFSRIKLASVVSDDAAPSPLFAFATEMTLTINNNVTPNKAIGVMGAFDTSAGTIEVGGSMTAYFASVEAAQAVRNNADITLDIIMLKRNAGMLFDIPLLSLGDGRLNVEQDQAITIPLETNAAESKFGHTLLFQSFSYLPNSAG